MSDAPVAPAGWYPDDEDPGLLRYWTGKRWTDDRSPAIASPSLAPAMRFVGAPAPYVPPPAGAKLMLTAYLLWGFLGGWGGHRHYLRRHGSAVVQTIASVIGAISGSVWLRQPWDQGLGWFVVVIFLFNAIWWVADAISIPRWVRTINEAEAEADRRDATIAERRERRRPSANPGPLTVPVAFETMPAEVPISLDDATLPWELREADENPRP